MCRSLDKGKMAIISNELLSIDLSNLNRKNVNIALDDFQQTIENCLDTIAPLKLIKIPTHKVWHEPWISKGISNSMDKCIKLYKQCIKKMQHKIKKKYKLYRNCLTIIKRKVKVNYYTK